MDQHKLPGDYGKNGQHSSQDDLCESIEMLIPAYGVGIADAQERAFIEANLAACPDAAAQLAQYRSLNEALLHSAPLLEPPAHLAQKLALAVQQKAAAPQPPLPTTTVSTAKRPSIFSRAYLLTAAAAILVIALVSLNVYWIIQNNQLRDTQQQIIAKLNDQDQMFREFGSGTTRRLELTVVNDTSTGVLPYAAILCDPNSQRGLLYVKNFPALPSDKAYQLWMRLNGKPVSLSVFKVDSNGSATIVFWTPETIKSFSNVGVTLEPSNGSASPTGSAIVRGILEY